MANDQSITARLGFSPGGRGTLLWKLYMYVPPHRVGFLRHFGLKKGTHFAHFGLESGMVFEGTTGGYGRIYRFNSKRVRNKEKYANSRWIWTIALFAPKGQARKRVWFLEVWSENRCGKLHFWSEIGSRFGEPGGPPPPRIPRSILRGSSTLYKLNVRHLSLPHTSTGFFEYFGWSKHFHSNLGPHLNRIFHQRTVDNHWHKNSYSCLECWCRFDHNPLAHESGSPKEVGAHTNWMV